LRINLVNYQDYTEMHGQRNIKKGWKIITIFKSHELERYTNRLTPLKSFCLYNAVFSTAMFRADLHGNVQVDSIDYHLKF